MTAGTKRIRRLRTVGGACLAATVCLAGAATSAAAADFTWGGSSSLPNWSDPSNWSGSAPNGAIGTLSFPSLTGAACAASPPSTTCYASNNDLSGLEANAISIDDGAGYAITGDGITLGSGGLTAGPSSLDPALADPTSILGVPLTLAAPQTWSVTGGAANPGLLIEAPVSGTSADTLAIRLDGRTQLDFENTDVGPVTVTGDGTFGDGFVGVGYLDATGKLVAGSLNATGGSPVSLTGGAELLSDDGTVGPVTTTGGGIQVGQLSQAGTLEVVGDVALDSQSLLAPVISQTGTTPGTDYSQLSATGTVNLGGVSGAGGAPGAALVLLDGELPNSTACEQLTPGDVDTLVTATGGLTGTPLLGVVNGAIAPLTNGSKVTLQCRGSGGTPPTATINYTTHAALATIDSSGTPGTLTDTELSNDLPDLETNSPVTLTATVSGESGTASGTVVFENRGTPISGCDAQPLTSSGTSYTAICDTQFPTTPAAKLTAVFDPANGSTLAPSTSTEVDLVVTPAPTTTTLTISPTTVGPGQTITATATVTQPASKGVAPSGTIDFLDTGASISPVDPGKPCVATAHGETLTSRCDITLSGGSGTTAQTITAAYSGDANFAASTSAQQTATYVGPAAPPGDTSPPTSGSSAPKPAVTGAGLAGVGRTDVTGTTADVIVTCKGAKGQRCTTALKMTTREKTKGGTLLSASAAVAKGKPKSKQQTVVVGTRTVTLDAGAGETVHVKLNAAGRRALARLHRLPVTLTAVQTVSHAASRHWTRRVAFVGTSRKK